MTFLVDLSKKMFLKNSQVVCSCFSSNIVCIFFLLYSRYPLEVQPNVIKTVPKGIFFAFVVVFSIKVFSKILIFFNFFASPGS